MTAGNVDLRAYLRRGDRIICGQGTGEPLTLSAALVAQSPDIGAMSVFVGACFAQTLRPDNVAHLTVGSYGTIGTTRALAAAGLLEIYPVHLSRVGRSILNGELGCDVALVQLSPKGPNGKHSLGPINDYMRAAITTARVVIAEINHAIPWTFGAELPDLERMALSIETDRAPAELAAHAPSAIETRIGQNIASIVDDGATLQVGIGGTIDALLSCLMDRRDIGVHSGMIGDSMLDLIESGVVTNASKSIDYGVSVTGALFGTKKLIDVAGNNPAIRVEPFEYTHSSAIMAKISNLITINSAIEVDISGSVNAEMTGGRYIGGTGGQVDFMHAGTSSPNGCSIIALPSTAAGGKLSRIRVSVENVTCARSDVDFVVTEHGVAELRGQPFRERFERMLAIADPTFREGLEKEASQRFERGF